MMETCRYCKQEKPGACERCGSLAVEVATVEFTWNSLTAKKAEVCWCRWCDALWLRLGGADRIFICADCRVKPASARHATHGEAA